MPVTFYPAKHKAEPFSARARVNPNTPDNILRAACPDQSKKSSEILQSSFPSSPDESLVPQKNSFVRTITQAYNTHQALVIRPDDVWLAILVQFNFYVNANAELLRSQFVQHEGKKELVVYAVGNRYSVDFGQMANQMTGLIQNVIDPALREWILPKFSTTTSNDTVVSAIVMMATLKEYFSYAFGLMCGIPKVTLEGEKSDWENILKRLEKLKSYGIQTIAWYHLLHPVLSQFVQAFNDPNGADNLDFWQQVAHYKGGGSGPTWLSGWITAFCAFNAKGQWLGNRFKSVPGNSQADPASLTSAEFASSYFEKPRIDSLTLHGSLYHSIDTDRIPAGFAEVDVVLDDNGETFQTLMVAGLVATRLSDNGCTLRPVSGWWMFVKKPEVAAQDKADEEAKAKGETVVPRGMPDMEL